MKFVPRQPREGINVSDTHPLAEAGILVVGLTAIFAAIVLVLIFLVEIALLFVSPEAEARLFEAFTPEDLIAVEDGDERLRETRVLLNRLTAHLEDSQYDYRLEITASELPNAMAFPGGLIVVTSALLDSAESENELAFILGHELGHFRNRDHLRRLGRGVLLGVIFGAALGADDGAGLGVTISQLTQLSFSREQETHADEVGLAIVYGEYGHVAGSWRFFERQAEASANSDVLTYLSTHPSPTTRIQDLRDFARQRGWPLSGPTTALRR